MTYPDNVTAFKDLILGIAACVGMVVAIVGLRTWNRQLKGGVEYELARRLLRQTFRLRDAIKDVRYHTLTYERVQAKEGEPPLGREDSEYRGLVLAYEGRWGKLVAVHSDLQTDLIEGEVVWGDAVHQKFKSLLALVEELGSAIRAYLASSNPSLDPETRGLYSDMLAKKRDVMYDTSDFQRNEYTEEIKLALAETEQYLRPKLDR
ncbi:hypothetical protein [Massilia sp. DWR3-1-1]|uniref:hypothetical protein n=1 Tax=Massilia sp. DWR3-1-1 TaxID=2804559 RepID=UPI003CFAF34B